MGKLIKTNGEVETISPKNGKTYELEELQKYVDGSIELVYLQGDAIMVVNEEGMWDKDLNNSATDMARQKGAHEVYLFGDVVLCMDNEIE